MWRDFSLRGELFGSLRGVKRPKRAIKKDYHNSDYISYMGRAEKEREMFLYGESVDWDMEKVLAYIDADMGDRPWVNRKRKRDIERDGEEAYISWIRETSKAYAEFYDAAMAFDPKAYEKWVIRQEYRKR